MGSECDQHQRDHDEHNQCYHEELEHVVEHRSAQTGYGDVAGVDQGHEDRHQLVGNSEHGIEQICRSHGLLHAHVGHHADREYHEEFMGDLAVSAFDELGERGGPGHPFADGKGDGNQSQERNRGSPPVVESTGNPEQHACFRRSHDRRGPDPGHADAGGNDAERQTPPARDQLVDGIDVKPPVSPGSDDSQQGSQPEEDDIAQPERKRCHTGLLGMNFG